MRRQEDHGQGKRKGRRAKLGRKKKPTPILIEEPNHALLHQLDYGNYVGLNWDKWKDHQGQVFIRRFRGIRSKGKWIGTEDYFQEWWLIPEGASTKKLIGLPHHMKVDED